MSFENDYFEFLLKKFIQISSLGVAGTRYIENDSLAIYSYKDVAGQCQLFKRECFEEIGGYFPSEYGCIDNIAVLTARMKGWKTITFGEKTFVHHRAMTSAGSNKWLAKFKHGRQDYLLGNHPLWESFRIIFQLTRKPYLIGGMFILAGFAWSSLSGMKRTISKEIINYNRKEQIQRLKIILQNLLKFKIRIEET